VSVAQTLVARTAPLPGDVDLLAFAGPDGYVLERDGTGLAGRGQALRIELPDGLGGVGATERVEATLASIVVEDEVGAPGTGAVALGALPFAPTAPGSLVVPEVVVGRSRDAAWMTTFGPLSPAPAARPPRARAPDTFNLTPALTHEEWAGLVRRAVAAIQAGDLRKVVLAREVLVEANRPIDVVAVLERLRALYPSCTVFSVDGFVGATPELLVARVGDRVSSHPLAGTIARSGDPDTDARLGAVLLESYKERQEHRFVVDDVAAVLRAHCATVDVPDAPTVVSLRNVSHLATRIAGTLRRPVSVLELAAQLHPTAAVGGTPRRSALDWLAANERLDRGQYAGPLGWVDAQGDGEWLLGIRSALVRGRMARLYAGVGVVADSDPAAELVETQLKLQALLAALVRP